MRRTTLPGTALQVSRLGFGTASLHHATSSRGRQALLATAYECGITHFDTARLYGHGMAERELGRFARDHRQHLTIATKFGLPASMMFETVPALMYVHKAAKSLGWPMRDRWTRPLLGRFSALEAEKSIRQSLRALATDSVDILFLHDPRESEFPAIAECATWLQTCKTRGLARYVGLSGSARDCVSIATRMPAVFDVLQVEDSIEGGEANAVAALGRPLQATFGYLRRARAATTPAAIEDTIKAAMQRNRNGVVVFSTRDPRRLSHLVSVAEGLAE
jgi:aryl-alcohol dehydrogenase-like predicted oxidoreductase